MGMKEKEKITMAITLSQVSSRNWGQAGEGKERSKDRSWISMWS